MRKIRGTDLRIYQKLIDPLRIDQGLAYQLRIDQRLFFRWLSDRGIVAGKVAPRESITIRAA
jgi:hypothetical protein